jgi:hypothetical protein
VARIKTFGALEVSVFSASCCFLLDWKVLQHWQASEPRVWNLCTLKPNDTTEETTHCRAVLVKFCNGEQYATEVDASKWWVIDKMPVLFKFLLWWFLCNFIDNIVWPLRTFGDILASLKLFKCLLRRFLCDLIDNIVWPLDTWILLLLAFNSSISCREDSSAVSYSYVCTLDPW